MPYYTTAVSFFEDASYFDAVYSYAFLRNKRSDAKLSLHGRFSLFEKAFLLTKLRRCQQKKDIGFHLVSQRVSLRV